MSAPVSAAPSVSAPTPVTAGPCAGSDLVLEAAFVNDKCRLFDKMSPEIDGVLEATLTASPAKVAPGGTTTLVVLLRNTSKAPVTFSLPMRQAQHPPVAVRDPQGQKIAPPAGKAVTKPNPQCAADDCGFVSAQVTIAPGGTATWSVPWKASRLAWPKGPVLESCCESRVDPVIAGPLPAGDYEVSLQVVPKVGGSAKVTVGP